MSFVCLRVLQVRLFDYVARLKELAAVDSTREPFDPAACDRLILEAPRAVQEAVLEYARHCGRAENRRSCLL